MLINGARQSECRLGKDRKHNKLLFTNGSTYESLGVYGKHLIDSFKASFTFKGVIY